MKEEDVRKIVKEEMSRNYRFGSPDVPPHQHDGVDNLPVNQPSINPGIPVFSSLVFTETETFTLSTLQNVTEISFFGFAANNAGGGGATARATISGTCLLTRGTRITSLQPRAGVIEPIIQVCNFSYTNETGPAFRVGMSTEYIAYATDGSSDLVTVEVSSFTQNTVTFQVTLASGWQVQGGYIFY